jgi:hypothetical protein
LQTVEHASESFSVKAPPPRLSSLFDCQQKLADSVTKELGLHLTRVTDV